VSKPAAAGPRRGGRPTPAGYEYELSGGALCLDFVNTVDYRPTSERKELLGTYSDLVAWARQAGALSTTQAAELRRGAERRPRDAETVLQRARAVREELFGVFATAAAGGRLHEEALDPLTQALAAALGRLRLVPAPRGGAAWDWEPDAAALDRMLWPVLRSAGELLTSAELARVRECAAARCAWLFLDHSRNRSRRWCDMTVCGNRDKVRRHRQRSRRRPGRRRRGPGES
jgi:predicted RNA-binding Zn ribbon-like protein